MHNHNPAHTHTQGHLLLDLAFLVPPGPLSLPLDQMNPSKEMKKELSSAFSEQDQPRHPMLVMTWERDQECNTFKVTVLNMGTHIMYILLDQAVLVTLVCRQAQGRQLDLGDP